LAFDKNTVSKFKNDGRIYIENKIRWQSKKALFLGFFWHFLKID